MMNAVFPVLCRYADARKGGQCVCITKDTVVMVSELDSKLP
jgi:hypothetical protein